jgi:glycerophosphoryl diester phosphodiesterase
MHVFREGNLTALNVPFEALQRIKINLIAVMAYSCGVSSWSLHRIAPKTIGKSHKPFVFSHRGTHTEFAKDENTIEAFRRTGTLGVSGVELDVRKTLDGHLIVHHDPHYFCNQSNAKKFIKNVKKEDLPVYIPSLREALAACDGWVNVEIKNNHHEVDFDETDGVADQVATELEEAGEIERFIVSSFRWETVTRIKALNPSIRTAYLTDGDDLFIENVAQKGAIEAIVNLIHSSNVDALHAKDSCISHELVQACQSKGIQISAWVVDCPNRATVLMNWGVNGLCTNQTEQIHQFVEVQTLIPCEA